jgi:hypothetical protein
MPRIICTRPNASSLINGIKFVAHEIGVISEEVEQAVADQFLKISGYFVEGQEPKPDDGTDTTQAKSKKKTDKAAAATPAAITPEVPVEPSADPVVATKADTTPAPEVAAEVATSSKTKAAIAADHIDDDTVF